MVFLAECCLVLLCLSVCIGAGTDGNVVTTRVKASWKSTSILAEAGEFFAQTSCSLSHEAPSYFHFIEYLTRGDDGKEANPIISELEEYNLILDYTSRNAPILTDGIKFSLAHRYFSPKVKYLSSLGGCKDNSVRPLRSACGLGLELDDIDHEDKIREFIANPCLDSFNVADGEHLFNEGSPFRFILNVDFKQVRRINTAFRVLKKEAIKSGFSFALRPLPANSTSPLFVSGYGVELMIKSTEYKVTDDSKLSDSKGENKENAEIEVDDSATENTSSKNANDEEALFSNAKMESLSTTAVERLGIKTTSMILKAKNPFAMLKRLSFNSPLLASTIVKAGVVTSGLVSSLTKIAEIEGQNILYLNNRQVELSFLNTYSLFKYTLRTQNSYQAFLKAGIKDRKEIRSLMVTVGEAGASGDDLEDASSYFPEPRFKMPLKDGISLNDIESDSRYSSWPRGMDSLLRPRYPGQMIFARKNFANILYFFDISHAPSVKMTVVTFVDYIKKQVPIKFVLVPVCQALPGDQCDSVLRLLAFATKSLGLKTVMKILGESNLANLDVPKYLGKQQKKISAEDLNNPEGEFEAKRKAWISLYKRLTPDSLPTMFFNGERIDMMSSVMGQAGSEGYESKTMRIYQRNVYYLQTLYAKGKLSSSDKPLEILEKQPHNLFESYSPYFDLKNEKYRFLKFSELVAYLNDSIYNNNKPQSAQESVILLLPREVKEPCKVIEGLKKASGSSVRWSVSYNGEADLSECLENRVSSSKDVEVIKVVINGHEIGPVEESDLIQDGFWESLLDFERKTFSGSCLEAANNLKSLQKSNGYLLCTVHRNLKESKQGYIVNGIFGSKSTSAAQLPEPQGLSFEAGKGSNETCLVCFKLWINPLSVVGQRLIGILEPYLSLEFANVKVILNPQRRLAELPVKRFYDFVSPSEPEFVTSKGQGSMRAPRATFTNIPDDPLFTLGMDEIQSWIVMPSESVFDLDNIRFKDYSGTVSKVSSVFELSHILVEGHCTNQFDSSPPRGLQFILGIGEDDSHFKEGTIVMANMGYFQLKANPGNWTLQLREGRSRDLFDLPALISNIPLYDFEGILLDAKVTPKPGKENEPILFEGDDRNSDSGIWGNIKKSIWKDPSTGSSSEGAEINIFSVASGHLYERFLRIMILSVLSQTKSKVKFWFIENFLSPLFKTIIPFMAKFYGFEYQMVTYKWPSWLRKQTEKQRTIWAYKILFLDVLFPLNLNKVIFVDADQIVRTDLLELIKLDLKGAPYGYTPFCDNRPEIDGFRFWKHGYWSSHLAGKPYHISALYVIDLVRFRRIAAGDRLRGTYHMLSADPNSLSNLDQDLPNHMQHEVPIFSLPQDWLWCETWCSSESLSTAKTIDLCNNPMTKEPKLERAMRLLPEWKVFDSRVKHFQEAIVQALGNDPTKEVYEQLLNTVEEWYKPEATKNNENEKQEL